MKKVLMLIFVAILGVGCFFGCSSISDPIGHEEDLDRVESAPPVSETEAWVMESKGFSSIDESIQRLYDSVEIDGTPQMYIGYQINPDGIDYAFTIKDEDNVQHLYILRQTVDGNISILKETTEFDLLDYFTN